MLGTGNSTVALPLITQMFPHLVGRQVFFNGMECGAVLTADGIKYSDGTLYTTPTSFTRRLSGSRSSGWKQLSVFVEDKHVPLWYYKNYYMRRIATAAAATAAAVAVQQQQQLQMKKDEETTATAATATEVQKPHVPQLPLAACAASAHKLSASPRVGSDAEDCDSPVQSVRTVRSSARSFHLSGRIPCIPFDDIEVAVAREVGQRGAGAFEARLRSSGARALAKRLDARGAHSGTDIVAQIGAHSALRHPHVLDAHGYSVAPDGTVYVLFEYVDTTLGAYIDSRWPDGMPLCEAVRQARDISRALKALSSAHGLLPLPVFTPDSVLLTPDGVPKVCDLALCGWLLGHTAPRERFTAPEVLLQQQQQQQQQQEQDQDDAARSDVFSFGAVLSTMLTGQLPYSRVVVPAGETLAARLAQRSEPLADMLSTPELRQRLARPNYVCGHLSALLEMCWREDPAQRPAFSQVVDILDNLQPTLETLPFWMPEDKAAFVRAVAEHMGTTHNEFTQALEESRAFLFGPDWRSTLDPAVQELVRLWRCDFTTINGLVAFVRMLLENADAGTLPPAAAAVIAASAPSRQPRCDMTAAILTYFEKRLPSLLEHMYRILSKDDEADIVQDAISDISAKYVPSSSRTF